MSSSSLLSIERGRTAVAPSILSADFSDLAGEIESVERAGADFHHLDVMDGHFVPNLTFGPMVVEAIDRLAGIPLITHLMISEPGRYAERFVEAGSDAVSFHFEAMEGGHGELIGGIRSGGAAAGLALNPDTPIRSAEDLLEEIDLLLIMSVFPGFGGQKFIEQTLRKIEKAAELKVSRGYRYIIEVDGGIDPVTAPRARSAGAECLVAGTAVYRSGDYAGAIATIRG